MKVAQVTLSGFFYAQSLIRSRRAISQPTSLLQVGFLLMRRLCLSILALQ